MHPASQAWPHTLTKPQPNVGGFVPFEENPKK
jgi:hypothetical protein